MTTVLITGVGGFVASHVLRHVMETTDWHVIGLDSFRHHGKLDRVQYQLEGQDRSRYTHLVYDLTIPFSEQFVERLGPVDYVLALASESHVERSIQTPRPFVENNVALQLTLLEWARQTSSIKAFLNVSTDEAMGPIAVGGHPEGAPHRPSNPYSSSKAIQEDLAFGWWRTYSVPVIITNSMNIIGPLQDVEKFLPMVVRAISRGETVTVHADKNGIPGTRFYLDARNQADALLWLLKNHTPAMYPADDLSRFNIVGEYEIDNLRLAQLIAEYMDKPLNYVLEDFHITRPGHDRRYGLDGSKISEAGWTAPVEFYDSLRSTVEWFVSHPEWLL